MAVGVFLRPETKGRKLNWRGDGWYELQALWTGTLLSHQSGWIYRYRQILGTGNWDWVAADLEGSWACWVFPSFLRRSLRERVEVCITAGMACAMQLTDRQWIYMDLKQPKPETQLGRTAG